MSGRRHDGSSACCCSTWPSTSASSPCCWCPSVSAASWRTFPARDWPVGGGARAGRRRARVSSPALAALLGAAARAAALGAAWIRGAGGDLAGSGAAGRATPATARHAAQFYTVAIGSGVAPLVIFMGVGAMTDFGPLLANPRTLLLGRGGTVRHLRHGARCRGTHGPGRYGFQHRPVRGHRHHRRCRRADGDLCGQLLAPDLLGAIAVAAYSYMALVPLIQPPIMRALTTEERAIEMRSCGRWAAGSASPSRSCCLSSWRCCCPMPRRSSACCASAT
jgi:hypothetical protein